jgi:hypothetical protein
MRASKGTFFACRKRMEDENPIDISIYIYIDGMVALLGQQLGLLCTGPGTGSPDLRGVHVSSESLDFVAPVSGILGVSVVST